MKPIGISAVLVVVIVSSAVFVIDVLCKYEICSHDTIPSAYEIIEYYGYKAERHYVTTEDGYILQLHRIRTKKALKKAVFLQHGFLGSSADWVLTGFDSLAMILSDYGYDVWLGNARGNTFSRAHKTLHITDPRFWQFSWHEMAIYDLPACFDYIRAETNKNIIYIGHSMGTTMSFVLFSNRTLNERYNKIVDKIISLAPVAFMKNVKTPFRRLATFQKQIQLMVTYFGIHNLLPRNWVTTKLLKTLCLMNSYEKALCENFIFLLTGFDKKQFDYRLLPCILHCSPAGTSMKTLIHFSQEILENGSFQMYDYGTKVNEQIYNSTVPPKYNISSINIPVQLFYSMNDWLSNNTDVEEFAANLKNYSTLYLIDDKHFNHIDYLWGINAKKLVYDHIINELDDTNLEHF